MSKLKAPRRVTRPVVTSSGVSRTKQSFKDECDINRIVARFRKTGDPFLLNPAGIAPTYADLPDVDSFHDSMNRVLAAEDAFAALPSKVRDRYRNDPGVFLAALADPSQVDFLTAEGIFEKTRGEAPPKPPEGAAAPSPEPPTTSVGEGKASG